MKQLKKYTVLKEECEEVIEKLFSKMPGSYTKEYDLWNIEISIECERKRKYEIMLYAYSLLD